MQETSYMNGKSILELVKVGCFSTELKKIAEDTKARAKTDKEKEWAKKFKCAHTYLQKIIHERLACLDKSQVKSVDRRCDHTVIEVYTTDQVRTEKEKDGVTYEPVTLEFNDFATLAELMLIGCRLCPQGKYVKDCPYRPLMHKVCIPVLRENPAEGECEFMGDNALEMILPNGNQEQTEIFAKKFAAKNLHILSRAESRKVKMI